MADHSLDWCHPSFWYLMKAILVRGRGVACQAPFMRKVDVWSIGIYEGSSPFELAPLASAQNPVITASDVTDVPAAFIADPFMLVDGGSHYMFFEVFNRETRLGSVGLAVSDNESEWKYRQIVIDEPFHLSYPHCFKWEENHYLIPESYQDASVRLYRASEFPVAWTYERSLLTGSDFVDPSIFRFNDRWWLFVGSAARHVLRLYFADNLHGPWREHPCSPVVKGNERTSRPAGRVLEIGVDIWRVAQDHALVYGREVNAFQIVELSPDKYEEDPVARPILRPTGCGWNAHGMHHVDAHNMGGRWLACVDGRRARRTF